MLHVLHAMLLHWLHAMLLHWFGMQCCCTGSACNVAALVACNVAALVRHAMLLHWLHAMLLHWFGMQCCCAGCMQCCCTGCMQCCCTGCMQCCCTGCMQCCCTGCMRHGWLRAGGRQECPVRHSSTHGVAGCNVGAAGFLWACASCAGHMCAADVEEASVTHSRLEDTAIHIKLV